ncbi:uncharacterized protein EAF02_009216 [Botrytis sinoallii]|uniref:uncharacterized protein n=1 Tax=Botrytis sinoallii TaxID=1463999 RepID=UPI001901CC6A|nr:uncharacterized protein EAF02_009216 [Botrytis sinoallii]KAF7872111.1 hypothetical protein EAF02_009216 [Botrytis sinoallii]
MTSRTQFALIEAEMNRRHHRPGVASRSHFLCIDAMVTRHKSILKLEDEFNPAKAVANVPTKASSASSSKASTTPFVAELSLPDHLALAGLLLDKRSKNGLRQYHRAQVYLSTARKIQAHLTTTLNQEVGVGSKNTYEKMIEARLDDAERVARRIISLEELVREDEACVPLLDIIHACEEIRSWLLNRKTALTNEVGDMEVDADASTPCNNHKDPAYWKGCVSNYTEPSNVSATTDTTDLVDGDDNDSDASTIKGVDDKAIKWKLNNDFYKTALASGPEQTLEYEEFYEIAALAEKDPEAILHNVSVELGTNPITTSQAKILYAFVFYLQRDRVGIANMMNEYLDSLDSKIDPGDEELSKLKNALRTMDIRVIGEAIAPGTSSSTSSASFPTTPSTLSASTSSIDAEGGSRKKRKFADDDEEDEIL